MKKPIRVWCGTSRPRRFRRFWMQPYPPIGRVSGICHAPPVFRRRIARVRAHQSPPRRLIPASSRQHSCAQRRAPGTVLAFVEADGCGAMSVVVCPGVRLWRLSCSSMRDGSHDPLRVRIHPGEVCSGGEQTMAVRNDKTYVSSRLETQLRSDRIGSNQRSAKVSLWIDDANMQTTETHTLADPSIKLEALGAITLPKLRWGRLRASDKLIASLTTRSFMRRENRSK
jgi:hypothetical protein